MTDTAFDTWMDTHGMIPPDLEAFGVELYNSYMIIPVFSMSGKEAFNLKRNWYGEQKYQVDPPGARRGFQLYGLNWTLKRILELQEAVVVEGFSDFIALSLAGVDNCVAMLGSKLSLIQRGLLANICKQAIVWSDGDETGENYATAVAELEVPGVRMCGMVIDTVDPAEFVARFGAREAAIALLQTDQYLRQGAKYVKYGTDLSIGAVLTTEVRTRPQLHSGLSY